MTDEHQLTDALKSAIWQTVRSGVCPRGKTWWDPVTFSQLKWFPRRIIHYTNIKHNFKQ